MGLPIRCKYFEKVRMCSGGSARVRRVRRVFCPHVEVDAIGMVGGRERMRSMSAIAVERWRLLRKEEVATRKSAGIEILS